MTFSILSTASAALLLVTASPALPADIYVDIANGNCTTGTGSAMSPVCTINAAIALSSPGDTLRIAPGVYSESVTIGFDLVLIGTQGAEVTVIQGMSQGPTTSLVTIPAGVTVTIDGLSILGGYSVAGGAVDLEGNLTLENSVVRGNRAVDSGAGIHAVVPGTSLTIRNCTVSFNETGTFNAGGVGGAIRMVGGTCTITESTMTGNRSGTGGAIHFRGADPSTHRLEVTRSTLDGNSVNGSASIARGGAILQVGGHLTLEDSAVTRNHSQMGGGGGLSVSAATFSLSNSTFSNNTTTAGGGGILIDQGANGLIADCTIAENTSAGTGVASGSPPGSTSVRNSIIARNFRTVASSFGDDVGGTYISLGHNLIGSDFGSSFVDGVNNDLVGTPANPIEPLLGALQDNGGRSETHALLPGSPALDAGDPQLFETLDQRGAARPQGLGPDIGAHEGFLSAGASDLCNGDGVNLSGCTPCPCGNDRASGTIGGCLHSGGLGGRLVRSGTNSMSAADLRFEARDLPANSAAILLSGAALAPANPTNPCFGQGTGFQTANFDGLNCIVQGIRRHGVRPANTAGEIGVTTNGWGTPNAFFGLNVFAAGQTRFFQIVYRDDPAAACSTGLNTTQAAGLTFAP